MKPRERAILSLFLFLGFADALEGVKGAGSHCNGPLKENRNKVACSTLGGWPPSPGRNLGGGKHLVSGTFKFLVSAWWSVLSPKG